uniref:Uncharacterized protein n=1 Tax=Tanacetum cinerariifolium TaxID=118510 RepID=A0A699HPH0_TANCI|nr:hypothetical protein [Tanacetum cinerariifolium]
MPHPSRYFKIPKTSSEEMMRKWMASQMEANEHMKYQGDVSFIGDDKIKPIPTMPSPNPINSNSSTVLSFLKDCIVQIPCLNVKTFADDVLPNHVGGEEFKSIGGVGIGKIKKKEIKKDGKGVPKEPNQE